MDFFEGTSCNTRSLYDEIQRVQTEIGRLQYKLMVFQNQLNNEHSRQGINQYTYTGSDNYAIYNGGF